MKKALAVFALALALTGCTGTGAVSPSRSGEPPAEPSVTAPAAEAPASGAPATEAPAEEVPAAPAEPPAQGAADPPAEVVPGPEEPGVGGWTPERVFAACTDALDRAYDRGALKSRAELDGSEVSEVTEGIWSVVIPVVRDDGDGQQGCTVQGTTDQPTIAVTDYSE